MRRLLGTVATALALVIPTGTPGAWAEPAGAGTPRWTSGYDLGDPAYSTDVAVTPDGMTVVETGESAFGPGGQIATLAYDAATGNRHWSTRFPQDRNISASARKLAVSHDGRTAFVVGYLTCRDNCSPSSNAWVTLAYDIATGDRLWVSRLPTVGGPEEVMTSPDDSSVYVEGVTDNAGVRTIVAYDQATGHERWLTHMETNRGSLNAAALSPDGSAIFVADSLPADQPSCVGEQGGYRTTAYDTADGRTLWSRTFTLPSDHGHCGAATDLEPSPDGSTVYVTGYGGDSDRYPGANRSATLAYDARTGTERWETTDDVIGSTSNDTGVLLQVTPDGSRVLISGDDCPDGYPFCAWSTRSYASDTGGPQWVSRYDGGGWALEADLAMSPDGKSVFLTGQERTPCAPSCDALTGIDAPLVAYDPESGDERWAATYPGDIGSALAVAPDSSSLYVAGSFTASVPTAKGRANTRGTECVGSCGFSTTRYNTKPGSATLQDPEMSLRYDGWRGSFDKGAIGGAYRSAGAKGATARFRTPRSTTVTWLTRKGPRAGKARLLIDGHGHGTYDLYAAKRQGDAITITGLSDRRHRVVVRVLGRRTDASRGTQVAVDGFRYLVQKGLVQESSPLVHYDAWRGVSSQYASGGSFRKTGSRGAKILVDFKGRSLRWVTATGPAFGRARVVIDGRPHTVDLYRPTRHWRVSYRFSHLPKGEHHVVIKVLGRKDAASRSTKVVLDALVVRRQ